MPPASDVAQHSRLGLCSKARFELRCCVLSRRARDLRSPWLAQHAKIILAHLTAVSVKMNDLALAESYGCARLRSPQAAGNRDSMCCSQTELAAPCAATRRYCSAHVPSLAASLDSRLDRCARLCCSRPSPALRRSCREGEPSAPRGDVFCAADHPSIYGRPRLRPNPPGAMAFSGRRRWRGPDLHSKIWLTESLVESRYCPCAADATCAANSSTKSPD